MMKNSRNQVIDLIKGLAIFTVVLGHCIQYGAGEIVIQSQSYYDNYLFKLIYSFHMPVFMVVSGYLFSKSVKKYSNRQLVEKGIRTLLIPIILWVLLYRVPEMLITFDQYDSIGRAFLKLFSYIVTGFWFLWAILLLQFFTLFIKKWVKDSIYIYIFVLIILLCIPDFMTTQLYKYMFPYFYVGYFWGKFNLRIEATNKFIKWGWIFIILTFIMLPAFTYRTYIYNNTITLIPNGYETYAEQIKNIVVRYLIGLSGSIGAIWVCVGIDRINHLVWLKKILCSLGKNSLGIYIISGYIVSLVLVPITTNISFNALTLSLETIIVMIISLVLTKLIQSIPILNKFLLGGR